MVHFLCVEGGGGLIQNDELCLAPQGLGDFQQLFLAGFQVAHLLGRVDPDPHACKQGGSFPVHPFFVDAA